MSSALKLLLPLILLLYVLLLVECMSNGVGAGFRLVIWFNGTLALLVDGTKSSNAPQLFFDEVFDSPH